MIHIASAAPDPGGANLDDPRYRSRVTAPSRFWALFRSVDGPYEAYGTSGRTPGLLRTAGMTPCGSVGLQFHVEAQNGCEQNPDCENADDDYGNEVSLECPILGSVINHGMQGNADR